MALKHHQSTRIWHAPAVRALRHSLSPSRLYRAATASRRRLPDYLVAGREKSGTTSLWAYLSEHPNVEPPLQKEMSFFDVNFHRGINWYRKHFPLRDEGGSGNTTANPTLTGESTAYYMFHPLAPQRIAETLPQVKIILLLRNPVDRAFSHYQLKMRRRQETLSFEDAISAEPERLAHEHEKLLAQRGHYSRAHDCHSYLARGQYLEQIARWEQFFPADRLLILESGEFFKRSAEVFQRVLDFLGLPRWQPDQLDNRFPGKYHEKMRDTTRRKLVDHFAPWNARLYAHLGARFDWDR